MYKGNLKNLYVINFCELFAQLLLFSFFGLQLFCYQARNIARTIIVFLCIVGLFYTPRFSLISANKNMQDALIAADRLFEIIDLETETNEEQEIELAAQSFG